MVNLSNEDQINGIIYFLDRCNSNNLHNPPKDYELILLVIINHDVFYGKTFKIIKKCYVGRHNLHSSLDVLKDRVH